MDTLLRDLRYLLRSLRSARAFSAVVVLTIAVAVGASTALFSVVDPLLLRAEPFRDAGRLMALWESPPRADGGVAPGKNEVSPGSFLDWSAERAVFDGVAAVAPWRPRANSGAPTSDSMRFNRRLNGGCAMCNWRAAAVNDPVRAIATTSSRSARSIPPW
jgi:hypothetical protein